MTEALAKIDKNKGGVVFVVDESNRLLGCLTDGDFRRQLIIQGSFDPTEIAVEAVCNRECKGS